MNHAHDTLQPRGIERMRISARARREEGAAAYAAGLLAPEEALVFIDCLLPSPGTHSPGCHHQTLIGAS